MQKGLLHFTLRGKTNVFNLWKNEQETVTNDVFFFLSTATEWIWKSNLHEISSSGFKSRGIARFRIQFSFKKRGKQCDRKEASSCRNPFSECVLYFSWQLNNYERMGWYWGIGGFSPGDILFFWNLPRVLVEFVRSASKICQRCSL